MSGDTLYEAPRRYRPASMRVHDYLYDSAYIVSDARDYARTAFKAAMQSAQVIIQPVYRTMFSEIRKFPRMQVIYHPNCRLPEHMDRSYGAYLDKVQSIQCVPAPQLTGKDRFKYAAYPKKLLPLKNASPDFHLPSPMHTPPEPTKPKSRGTQSLFRESSAQTIPWQPDGKPVADCENLPEVIYLDKLQWGPGNPYRTGDLPADFHTTEIINKMRHARVWNDLVEKGLLARWLKKADAIIEDVETRDWIFREAEIDELQSIRLALLHRMQLQQRQKQNFRNSRMLANLWERKKHEMERKVNRIRHTRDRELRKLEALHGGGGRAGAVARLRAARGAGCMTAAARDPTSDLHAPIARHGYQARGRHATICYDPTLLSLEDHMEIAQPPEWLQRCGKDLKHSCSGHHLPRDPTTLCERETRWSEQFLENLHNDLKKARIGASKTCGGGPLRVVRARGPAVCARPETPSVEEVPEREEAPHQAALVLQRALRGRAVQTLMYEGRTRAAELTEELKTTHGLQMEDRARISREEAKCREYTALRTEAEQKEDAIAALVDELCGGAVSAALDFLEKELRRLKNERRQHAFLLIAIREKVMREAAEAGRRQKEEHRRREHDEMFKQVLGITQETVEVYLQQVVREGVALAAEEHAAQDAGARAARADAAAALRDYGAMGTAEQHEAVAELVQQFLVPSAARQAARGRVLVAQRGRSRAAHAAIFGLLDDARSARTHQLCIRCGCPLDELCRCRTCPVEQEPTTTDARDDPRWRYTRIRPVPPPKPLGERYPPQHEFRCMLNTLIDEVVLSSRGQRSEREEVRREYAHSLRHNLDLAIETSELLNLIIDRATGAAVTPAKRVDYHHMMKRVIEDALERTQPPARSACPKELPSEIRQCELEKRFLDDPTCHCDEEEQDRKIVTVLGAADTSSGGKTAPLPTDLRMLEELKRCKCDSQTPTTGPDDSSALTMTIDEEDNIFDTDVATTEVTDDA